MFDPFSALGGVAGKLVADTWSAMMMTVWSGGLWVLRMVLQLENHFLTPDITTDGPAQQVYALTGWLALCLLLVMLMVQLGTAAIRRDGKSLGRVLIGTAQFIVVWVTWVVYAAAVITACGALTSNLMKTLFGVDSLGEWQPFAELQPEDITDATVATVLGMLGGLLWLAGIAHLLVLLTRAGALIVLAVTTPICAAGLVSEAGRSWFWKSFRWFHAAAFTPVVMTLMMGLGVQIASSVVVDVTDGTQAAVGTALPAVGMILMSAISPLALFKLLAFMDPGTNSGAAGRAGMAAIGGLAGLVGRDGGSNAAASADSMGRSAGEQQAENANTTRMAANSAAGAAGTAAGGAAGGGLAAGVAGVLGPVGAAVATGIRVVASVGSSAAAVGADLTNQMGVGHQTYQPDWGNPPGSRPPRPHHPDQGDPDQGSGSGQGDGPQDAHQTDQTAPDWTPPAGAAPIPNIGGSPAASGPAGSGGPAVAGGGSAAAAAAAV